MGDKKRRKRFSDGQELTHNGIRIIKGERNKEKKRDADMCATPECPNERDQGKFCEDCRQKGIRGFKKGELAQTG